jgi:PAS domain S-box-containing protein
MNRTSDKATAALRADWLTGGGEMGRLIRVMDWSRTSVGSIASWPQSLKTAVSILLNSHYPMFVWWGRELTNIYNDAYIPMLGARHPQALGRSAPNVWADVWPVVGPQAEVVMREGRATWNESILLIMERHGYTEETYFTFSYSPAPDDAGGVGGVFCAVTEDTARVLGARRLKTLRDLGERSLSETKTAEQACRAAAVTLADNPHDFPFALIYLLDEDGRRARLCETVNLPAGTKASPETVIIGSGDDVWNFGRVIETSQSQIVEDLEERFGRLPAGPWTDDWTKRALALPLAKAGEQELSAGFLVAGISPRLAFNDDYRSFLDLAAGQIANAISNARAYEEERKRAEALAEIDRAKTAFFSNVSHEFRTPLTLMLGPIEDAVAEGGLSPEAHEGLKVARRNSLRLLKLVNTLLDFSRIEAGRIQAAFEPVDLAALTADLVSVFRSTIERAGMRLTVDCRPLEEPVYVDRDMWEKIVLNLVSNAFKFTFEGEIEVSLKKAGASVELTVRDTGAGIPAEDLPHIFDRFHRVKGARGRSYEGSGIGLALVHELVKLHGGTARVESEVGRGSAFIVSIPLGKAHLPADHVGAAHSPASTGLRAEAYIEEALRWLPEEDVATWRRGDGATGSAERRQIEDTISPRRPVAPSPRPRVLLADDNADMREYVRRLLGGQYEVEAVADGEEALKAARVRAFDLILTDVMMPRLDGFGLLRELRDDERTREIPVILLSARAGEESKVEGLEAGANDYLVKPFSARELLARVEAMLQIQRVRRESQEALRASERKFSTAFNQSPLPMVITSLDNERLEEVNESFVRLSGYTKEESLGRTAKELRLLAEWERRDEGLRRLRAGERVYGFEARFLTKSGEERIGVIRSSLIEINSRPYVLSSFTDLTERKRAEDAIRQLAAIVESSDDAIYSRDLNGVIRSWNKGAEKLFGYAAEEVIGKSIMILIPPDRADEETRVLESVRRGAKIDHYETVRRRKDGALVEISLTVSPLRDEAGNLIGASKIARDITERKRAEQALAEGERQQRALYQLADHLHRARSLGDVYNAALDAILSSLRCDRAAILLFDDAGVMRFAGWRGLSDCYRKAVEGHSPWEAEERYPEPICVNDVGAAEIDDSLKAVVKGEGIGALAFIPLVSRGKLIGKFMTYFNAPHVFSDDELALSLTIARQLAFGIDRKRAEEEIARLLTEEQAAREVAEQATRAKDEFLAVVSHELRSPLNAILGWNRLLRAQRGDDPQIVKVAETVERSGKAQMQLIEDLLDTARIISGKLKLELGPVEPVLVIEQAVQTIHPAADAKEISIETDLPFEIGQITGDPTRLQQVVWNLLSNAVKFTPQGGRVEVRLERIDPHVCITVSDTGKGISSDFLPYVFDRFRQADASSAKRHGGLGLGLPLVKYLVELHGGTVEAASAGEGQGATFKVTLPVRAVAAPLGEAGGSPATVESSGKLAGVRVLVVDDQDDARELLEMALAFYGADVVTASSAAEAYELITTAPSRKRPDVIVTDLGMPGEDGYSLMRRVREWERERDFYTPAVALSAYGRTEDRMSALKAGFQMHVAKPVDPADLAIVIENLIRD